MAKTTKPGKKAQLTVFFIVFLDLVGFGILIPLSPYLARTYDASAFEIGLLMTIYSVMQFLMAPVWGRLSDKRGRKNILILCLFGACAAYLLFAFSKTYLGLVLARALAGFFGASISTAQAYMADITESKDRSKAMGMVGAAFGLGFIFGPILGAGFAAIGDLLGTEAPFGPNFASVGAALLCFLNAAFALRYLQESRVKQQKMESGEKSKWSLLQDLVLNPKKLNKNIRVLFFSFFTCSLAMAQMEVMLFPYVQDTLGWSYKTASIGFAYVGVMIAFTQGYLVRKTVPRFGEKIMLFAGVVLFALSLYLIPFSLSLGSLALVMTVLALGNGLLRPSFFGMVSVDTDEDHQGQILGAMHSLSSLGRIIGPVMGGYLYDHWGKGAPFSMSGVITTLGLIVLLVFGGQLRSAGKESQSGNS